MVTIGGKGANAPEIANRTVAVCNISFRALSADVLKLVDVWVYLLHGANSKKTLVIALHFRVPFRPQQLRLRRPNETH